MPGPHLRIATVATPAIADAVAAVRASIGHCERIEVRLDALWPTVPDEATLADHLTRLLDAADGTPLLATLRPKRQGGAYEGPEDVRLNLLAAAAQVGFHTIDLEADQPETGALVLHLQGLGAEVVMSDHRLPTTPSKDQGLIALQAMQDAHADVQKLAFPAVSFADTLRALELDHRFAGVQGRPAVVPIGPGAMVRALLPLAGARATYGHAPGTRPAVSGQPALADVQAVWDHWGLAPAELDACNGHWIAVLGTPLGHSLSPRIHNAALRAAGHAERYGALEVPDSIGALRLLFSVADRIGLIGAGVTTPLKRHALDACDADDVARAVGAVNTVRFRNGMVQGTNTDAIGLRRLLDRMPGRVGVLGAGGAARAAVQAARSLGRDVTFTSRDAARAAKVRDDLGAAWIPWDERATMAPDVWVQCTTLGSDPADPSPLERFGAGALIEMVYAGGPTALERQARTAGAMVVDGVEVLVRQAADQYRYWLGHDPDEAAMRGALP